MFEKMHVYLEYYTMYMHIKTLHGTTHKYVQIYVKSKVNK